LNNEQVLILTDYAAFKTTHRFSDIFCSKFLSVSWTVLMVIYRFKRYAILWVISAHRRC